MDKWQEIKAEAESDPTALLKKLESGALGDYQVPVMYSNIHANEVARQRRHPGLCLDAGGDRGL